jgi:probable rRNA maturation factor
VFRPRAICLKIELHDTTRATRRGLYRRPALASGAPETSRKGGALSVTRQAAARVETAERAQGVSGPMNMNVDLVIEDDRWATAGLRALAERACGAALAHFGIAGAEISLLACDDARITLLNADFRAKPTPTNVLSWPSEERGAAQPGGDPVPPTDLELGDIAIAWETCAGEAEAAGTPFADHVSHLLVHATLHLLGYDHIDDTDAGLMEALEVEILGKLGIANPYGETGA